MITRQRPVSPLTFIQRLNWCHTSEMCTPPSMCIALLSPSKKAQRISIRNTQLHMRTISERVHLYLHCVPKISKLLALPCIGKLHGEIIGGYCMYEVLNYCIRNADKDGYHCIHTCNIRMHWSHTLSSAGGRDFPAPLWSMRMMR